MKQFCLWLLCMACFVAARAQDPDYPLAPAAAQNITSAEYFIDTDPGLGNGTAIPVSAAVNISNFAATINTSGLTNGVHTIYIRTKNNEGSWSLSYLRQFIMDFDPLYTSAPSAAQNIIAAEYFIDTDPGMGNATSIAITPGLNLTDLSVAINTTGLPWGVHHLYLRTKNAEGSWSLTQVKDFIVDANPDYPMAPSAAENIVAAEYFIDTDPGLGSGIAVPVAPNTTISNIALQANTAGLTVGVHRIYLRTKNNEGRWSLTNLSSFTVDQNYAYPDAPPAPGAIVAAEYFIDTDPGTGSGTAIAITPGTDINAISATVNTASLANGQHFLYIRTKNAEGAWSLTNHGSFYKDLLSLSADSLLYGNVPVNTTSTRNLVITNNSSSAQTITSASTVAPFSTDFSGTRTIAAQSKDTIRVSFTPTAANSYIENLQLVTSAGTYNVGVRGTGVTQVPSWTLSPATGHSFGNVAVNGTAGFTFSIQNTGNVAATLANITTTDPVFVPVFTAGTVIQPNTSVTFPVSFNPTAVNNYSAQLKIESSTPGVSAVTTTLTGSGYNPGAPPVLQLIAGSPFNGSAGVNPIAGQPGNFVYKVLYRSPNNRAPQTGFPRVSVDLNGDQDFTDLDEGVFVMIKETAGIDYATGIVYSYTYTHNAVTSNAGYQFTATDDQGNSAISTATGYINGPVVSNDRIDLRIFANDISFSSNTIAPGQNFTVFARVSNNTAIPASNVPVKFYRDTILIGEEVIPAVNAFSSATVSRSLSFATDGFYPIKVWIDSSNTLNDINPLNNYAIRPVTVGRPLLPGGINVTTTASIQQCPQLKVLISGYATYFGTGSVTTVAGAEVTIHTPTQDIITTTNADGYYSYVLTAVTCGTSLEYNVTVTDFTFTSSPAHNLLNVPCPPPGACVPAPSMGGVGAMVTSSGCTNIVGGTGTVNIKLKYRERNLANFWCLFDEIKNDTLRVYQDGNLIQTIGSADYSHGPGTEVIVPINIPLTSTTPTTISATLSYVYVEYLQIPSSLYHGNNNAMSSSGSVTIHAEPNQPDLTIQQFSQTSYTSFRFDNANIRCVNAGAHVVRIYDSIPGGSMTLVATRNFSSLAAGSATTVSYSDPNISSGLHLIKVVTDADLGVAETDENNNSFLFSIFVPESELTVENITASPTDLPAGSTTQFKAIVKNTGRTAGDFDVRFTVAGTQVGGLKRVNGLAENSSIEVISDAYTVTTAPNSCGDIVEVFADYGNMVVEQSNANNARQIKLGADLSPYQKPGETGSAGNPAVVRVFTTNQFFPAIRNIGHRDAKDVTVRFELNNTWIGFDTIRHVKAGEVFASHASFTRMFTVAGDYVVKVTADTLNTICENDETNNEGNFYIRVVDSKPDLEVLSQYISPSSLNPNIGQSITLVGTVRNTGGKVTTPTVVRFLVDDIQLGSDVAINAVQPGKDTTVQATATYSSLIPGVKVMQLVADPANTLVEEREDNNYATRTMIVGDAPDMVRVGAVRFNPTGFAAGDSAAVSFYIKNQGPHEGDAWVRIILMDTTYATFAIDSLPFAVASGDSVLLSKRMLFTADEGYVITQIYNCNPLESNMENNRDTLRFTTIAKMKQSVTINGDLDMKMAAPDQLPGWIGGKIMLGNYDLVVNGVVLNYDSTRFVITNGTGRLKLANTNPENIFPVASSDTSLNFVRLNNTGTPDHFSVRVAEYVLQQGNTGDTVRSSHVNRTWFIEEETPGGSNATAEFWWSAGHEQNGFTRNTSRTAHYTSQWEYGAIGAAVPGRYAQYSRVQNGFTSFSPFTINTPGQTLPLTFLSFTASNRPDDVLLQWKTANEVNTSHFVVERSSDGILFTSIGNTPSLNTAGVHDYQSIDGSPVTGISYYRLKQVDIDGRFVYSSVVKISRQQLQSLVLYPNPAHDIIRLKDITAGDVKLVQLFSTEGRMIWQAGSPAVLQWDVRQLPNALYQLRITKTDGEVQTISFIKK